MAATKHVTRTFWREFTYCRKHDFRKIFVTMLFHDWNNSTNRMDSKIKLTHSLSGLLSQITIDSTLNRTVQHRTLSCFNGCLTAFNGCSHRLLNFFFAHVWSAKNVEHRCDIHANGTLEFDDFFNADFDISIHIGLEGS